MVLSLLISRVVYLPFLQRGTTQFAMVMVTVAVSFILKNVLQIFSGANFYSYRLPPQQPVHLLGMVFTPRQLAIIGLAVASLLGLHLLFQYTRLGKAMRATSDDPGAGPQRRDPHLPRDQRRLAAVRAAGRPGRGSRWPWTWARFDSNTGGSFPPDHRGGGCLRQRRGALRGGGRRAWSSGVASEARGDRQPRPQGRRGLHDPGPGPAGPARWPPFRPGADAGRGHRVSGALGSYAATLVVYLGVNTIACWGLNLQFRGRRGDELRVHPVPGHGRVHHGGG